MRRHIICSILLMANSVMFAKPATESADTFAVHHLDEAVVTATRTPSDAKSSTPMRVLDSELMLRSGVTDVSDALHRMPGVILRDYGGAGGLKTVSIRGFGSGHTGVSFDYVPLSNVQTGQIDLSRYSIDNVGAVTMTVGDGDNIFIPARLAASAATVSIASMPLTDRFELTAKLRGGSFGLINPFLKAGTPLGSHSAINFVGEYMHADNDYPFTLRNGYLTTRERRSNSRMNSGHAELNWLWQPDADNTLAAKAYYYTSHRRLPGPVILYNNDNHERLAESNAMGQMRWQRRVSRCVQTMLIAKYSYASSLYRDEDGKYPGGVLVQNYFQREAYVAGGVLYTPSQALSFNYSADYFHNNLNSNLPADRRPYRNSVLQSVTGKYASGRVSAMVRLLCSLYFNGAHTGTAARDARRLSPSASVSVQPWWEHLLFVRASYKNIFRMPTFNEAYFDHYGSTDIRPENTDQFNLGITYTAPSSSWLECASFTADAYFNRVRDMIVGVPYNMFVWSMVNLGKVNIVGLDATANVKATAAPRHSIGLTACYSYQRAMPRTNPEASDWMKQVAYIPRHSGSAALSYENPWVNVSVHAVGVSDRYTTNANLPATRIAGYIEAGATLWRRFAFRNHSIELRADLLNIFNKQYCIVAHYPMPGRALQATVTFEY